MIGEDSGIEAAALDGRPGIASARWADDGVARLLAELDGVADRRARYVCVIVAIGPAGEEVVATGTLEGAIATAPRGSEGFGYDPIFVPVGESAHRRRARERLEDAALRTARRSPPRALRRRLLARVTTQAPEPC